MSATSPGQARVERMDGMTKVLNSLAKACIRPTRDQVETYVQEAHRLRAWLVG